MSQGNGFESFVNKYPLQKTLRFELIPQGKTLEHIEAKGFLKKDEERAESYKKMKKTIDGFHKYFIELAMKEVELTQLEKFEELYNEKSERKKEKTFKDEFEKVQKELRKEVKKGFISGKAKDVHDDLFNGKLIKKRLESWIKEQKTGEVESKEEKKEQEDEIYFDEGFKTFTTYFNGFHENRRNLYTDEPHGTAIAYRLIHENLPKFLDNIKIYEEAKNNKRFNFTKIEQELKPLIQETPLDDIFTLSYFNNTMTQKGIDFYNSVLGGYVEETGMKIRGINEFINTEFNQKKQKKKDKIPKFKPLYKQILSDRESISFLPDKFEMGQDVLESIEEYYKANLLTFNFDGQDDSVNVLKEIENLLKDLKKFDLNKVYIRNGRAITDISNSIFSDWSTIKTALEFTFLQSLTSGKKGLTKKQSKEKENYLKQSYFSVAEIDKALNVYRKETDVLKDLKKEDHSIVNYFDAHFKTKKKEPSDKELNLIANVEAKYSTIKGLLNSPYPEGKRLHQDKTNIDNIKHFLDSLMELLHFVKPLALPSDSTLEKDESFYGLFNTLYEELRKLTKLYDKVRNYATQKPYSIEKFKLNFENVQLLNGWDVNKERDYLTTILKKDGCYFLAIMDKKHNKVLQNIEQHQVGDCYEKMVYKLLPGVNKMLPKVFFSEKNRDYFYPPEELLKRYDAKTHKKGDNFSLQDCHSLIDFFKAWSSPKKPETI